MALSAPIIQLRKGFCFIKGDCLSLENPLLKDRLLQFIYASLWGGHSGFDKTMTKVKREFFLAWIEDKCTKVYIEM